MGLKLHVLTRPPPPPLPYHTGTSDGHAGHARNKAARAAVPDQKASASPHDRACDEALQGLGKSKEMDFCSFQGRHVSYMGSGHLHSTALGNPFGI